ncbi:MAG: LuxR C-terminal-related transcriptional regulator [Egibacteraceae bacterium]
MLLGRGDERGRIDACVDAGRRGAGVALVLDGEPGIGKTSLLGYARRQAVGMRVLEMRPPDQRAPGSVALGLLLRPLVGALTVMSRAEAAVLRPVIASRGTVAPVPELARAVWTLLHQGARQQPILVIGDDVDCLDASSAAVLALVAARLDGERIAMLLAAGDGGFAAPGVRTQRVSGLDRDSARALFALRASREPHPGVLDQLLAGTGGNPLALRDLATSLRKSQLAGQEPLPFPLPVSERIVRGFLKCLQDRGLPAGNALLLLAAAGTESRAVLDLATEFVAGGSGGSGEAFDEAVQAGIAERDGDRVRLRHPLLRSAAYHGVDVESRRAAHLALARALAELAGPDGTDRREWHRAAAAACRPGASLDAVVEVAALYAYREGRYATAARGFERAAALALEPDDDHRLLARAAGTWYLAGDRASAIEALNRAGGVAQLTDPRTGALVMLDTAVSDLLAGRPLRASEKAAHARRIAASLGGAAARITLLCAGSIAVAAGQAQHHAMLVEDPPPVEGHGMELVAQALIWLERYTDAEKVLTEIVRRARANEERARLPVPLALLADAAFRTGRFQTALMFASEAVKVGELVGQSTGQALGHGTLARLDAVRGLGGRARSQAAAALTAAPGAAWPAVRPQAIAALGLLALGFGEVNEAIGHLKKAGRLVADQGLRDPSIVTWAPDLVEAYARAGRTSEALRLLDTFAAEAERTERAWALAATARCRGLLAQPGEFEHHFAAAFRWHASPASPFEWARTSLCLGTRLRQDSRPIEARPHLVNALETFEHLGAVPWAQRARAELRLMGDHADIPPWTQRRLTPKEAEVAWHACQGQTNREIAHQLGVTPRTVAFHLGNIYRKLDVRSRSELSGAAPTGRLRAS